MDAKEIITLEFDGGSRGNPGPAGIGIVVRAGDRTPLVTLGRFIGRATNNVAEYRALSPRWKRPGSWAPATSSFAAIAS
jgi:ribonuclease HI